MIVSRLVNWFVYCLKMQLNKKYQTRGEEAATIFIILADKLLYSISDMVFNYTKDVMFPGI